MLSPALAASAEKCVSLWRWGGSLSAEWPVVCPVCDSRGGWRLCPFTRTGLWILGECRCLVTWGASYPSCQSPDAGPLATGGQV